MSVDSDLALRQYERIFSAISDCVALVDRGYVYKVINQAYTVWNHKTYEEIIDHSVSDLFGEEVFQTLLKPRLDQALLGQTAYLQEWIHYADGHDRFVRVSFSPYVELDNTVTGVVIVAHDFTHLKRAETALAVAKDRQRLILHLNHVGTWDWDMVHDEMAWSEESFVLVGLDPKTTMPSYQVFRNVVHPEDIGPLEANLRTVLHTGSDFEQEYRAILPDGTHRWLVAKAQCFHHNGQPVRMAGILLDISDRKAAEIALQKQKQFTEQIAESSLAILYIYDLVDNRNVYVNAQIEAILGYSPAEVQAMGSDLFPALIHPDDLPEQWVSYQRCFSLKDGEMLETEYRMRHKQGEYRWLLSRDRIFSRTESGAPWQILGVAIDITRLKQAEAALHQQTRREQLVAAITNRIRQSLDLAEILAVTVHEVQQVLQADRVLIFQLHQDGSGIIVAEAVVSDYPVTEKMRWLDECFPDDCYEFYRQGQPRIVPDVAVDPWASCLVEFMAEMGVKAKVVAPIVQSQGEGIIQPQVWGLLIAHACAAYREWQADEADLLRRVADNLAIAIQQAALYQQSQQELAERQRAEAALQALNRDLEARVQERTQTLQQQAEQEHLLRVIVQNIHRSLDIDEVLATVLAETRRTLQADRVAVYQFNADWHGSFIAESVGPGWSPLVGKEVKPIWKDTHLKETKGGRYKNNETFAVNDIYTVGHRQCHIDLLEQFQARAYAIAPIFVQDQLWGLLAAYQNSTPRVWQEWEVNLLRQIGMQTAIALRQSQLYQTSLEQVQELERLSQIKDDFLSTVSHELRSPMANIKMATQMLELQLVRQGILDGKEDTAFSRYFKILREECQREISLINDLLDLTRLDASTEPLVLTPISLHSWINNIASAFTERTRQQHQKLHVEIPIHLVLETEVAALERIVVELLHNACKYTPAGETIRIFAQLLKDSPTSRSGESSNHWVPKIQLGISNSGVEIPPLECDRIFDKFYRIPNHDPWKHGGTGLGLALVKKLTERLGGTIQVESAANWTTFLLEFTT